mmetsp:Transcript_20360/g.36396  ORF Transcript_20360/g.36396 Transcript_20360/m.36396 type:complete len:408 (+) Transcript_20360:128-1351(+)
MHFNDVSISLPAKVRGSEAEEEWQEVDWVTWSTGAVNIDPESFLMVFNPTGAGSVKAKPLGNLIRASAVSCQGEEVKTFIVETSESLHKTYRLTFSNVKHASDFSNLAKQAEAAHEASSQLKDLGASNTQRDDGLEADIRSKLDGRWPLVFIGAELYGPDPNSASSGSEVLLGRGAAVLVDPPEDIRVGSYELVFYCEDVGAEKPISTFTIVPKMTLERQAASEEDLDGPAASFLLTSFGKPAHTLCFEDNDVAGAFARDFRVRQKLMDVSLKTAKGQKAARELRGELTGLREQSLIARMLGLLRLLMLIAALACLARLAQLYLQDAVKQQPAVYMQMLKRDVGHVLSMSAASSKRAVQKACELSVGSAAEDDVRACSQLAQASDIRRCLDRLTGRAPVIDSDFSGW